jgi:hypothetical protein
VEIFSIGDVKIRLLPLAPRDRFFLTKQRVGAGQLRRHFRTVQQPPQPSLALMQPQFRRAN